MVASDIENNKSVTTIECFSAKWHLQCRSKNVKRTELRQGGSGQLVEDSWVAGSSPANLPGQGNPWYLS